MEFNWSPNWNRHSREALKALTAGYAGGVAVEGGGTLLQAFLLFGLVSLSFAVSEAMYGKPEQETDEKSEEDRVIRRAS